MAWGLIAGISYTELLGMRPGVVLDLFMYRFRYDCQQHGLREMPEGSNDTDL